MGNFRRVVVGLIFALGCQVQGRNESATDASVHLDTCSEPSVVCSGACVDLTSDEANCGQCGTACGATQFCKQGTCAKQACGGEFPCPDGQDCVNGSCVSPADMTVVLASTPTVIACGANHTCALLASGGVMCWGANNSGQLGNGTNTDSSVPVNVSGISTAIALSAGTTFSCAVLADGSVKCWGDNYYGELGTGTNTSSNTPVSVTGVASAAVAISSGNITTCITLATGAVQCWGDNTNGEVGDGTNSGRSSATATSGISSGAISTDVDGHGCAIVNGTLKCWGLNYFGEIGDGTKMNTRLTPVSVLNISGPYATQSSPSQLVVTTGGWFSCVILSSGAVDCWGQNNVGQLGNGGGSDSTSPVAVTGLTSAVALTSAWYHACALTSSGAVKCWGDNEKGQVSSGAGATVSTATTVAGLGTPATSISAGGSEFAINSIGYTTGQSCAIVSGHVFCWGDNTFGQLGNGAKTSSATPVGVSGL